MDDAIRTLAPKIAAHLAASETAHITSRNLSSLSATDAMKIQSGLDRALRKRLRSPTAVDVSLTVSENVRGFLIVAQVRQDVEMAAFRMEPANNAPKGSITKTLIWQQDAPILDVSIIEDQMLVLDAVAVTRYEHRERAESAPLAVPMPRDPRGRIEIRGDTLTAHLPGSTCRGTWKPTALACEPGGEISAGRNTLDDPAWPSHYAHVRIGEDDLLSEIDGRVHAYNSRNPGRTFDQWGSDFVAVCDSTHVLASGPGDRDSRDLLALYEWANSAPVRVSDPVEFPGPISALSPSIAVAKNLSTGRYEAYSLTVDCGR
jgi:hypothetical protein